ncbi:MAG: hypothetical protein AAF938_12470 [Myxococcota bacterium]
MNERDAIDDVLEGWVEAARSDAPNDGTLARVAERLPAPPPTGGGLGAPAAGGAALAIAAAIGLVFWVANDGSEPAQPPPPRELAVAPVAAPEPPSPALPPAVEAREPVPEAPAMTTRPVSPDPQNELRWLREARSFEQSAPPRALRLTRRHARHFPNSQLAQEREAIAIGALSASGAQARARNRAARFLRRWPNSAHRERIERLVAEH